MLLDPFLTNWFLSLVLFQWKCLHVSSFEAVLLMDIICFLFLHDDLLPLLPFSLSLRNSKRLYSKFLYKLVFQFSLCLKLKAKSQINLIFVIKKRGRERIISFGDSSKADLKKKTTTTYIF